MPAKVVRTAAEILGPGSTGSGEQVPTPEVTEPKQPVDTTPEPGFETPQPEPSVLAEAVAAAGIEIPPQESAPAPQQVAEAVPAKPPVEAEKPKLIVPQEPQPKPAPVERRFVKNIHTGEVLRFRDGSTFQFQHALLITSDPVLIANIESVAARHNIVT